MYSNHLEPLKKVPLLLHLLELRDVGLLDRGEPQGPGIRAAELRFISQDNQADSLLRQVEEEELLAQQVVSHLQVFASSAGEALQDLQQMRLLLRPPLPFRIQLRGVEEPDVVLHVRDECRHQLLLHHLFCDLLHRHRGLRGSVCFRAD